MRAIALALLLAASLIVALTLPEKAPWLVDPSDPSRPLAGGTVVDVPFHWVATLDLNANEVIRDRALGHRLGLVGVIEIVTGPGPKLMEEEGLLPGASLQVFDNDTGRTGVVVIAIRNRSKSR